MLGPDADGDLGQTGVVQQRQLVALELQRGVPADPHAGC